MPTFSRLRGSRLARAGRLLDLDALPLRSRQLAFVLSLLLSFAMAEAAVHWALRLLARPRAVPAAALRAAGDAVDAQAHAAAALFGEQPQQAARAPARYRLYGVIGGGRLAGAALIGIDGGAAHAFGVGALIAPGVRLVSTSFGHAELDVQGRRSVLDSEPASGGPGGLAQRPAPVASLPVLHEAPVFHPAPVREQPRPD